MKHLVAFLLFTCGMLSILPFAGCKDTINNNNGQTTIVFPDSNISYKKHVQPLFNLSCNGSGCHDAATEPDRGYDFEHWSDFMYVPGLVYAHDPDNSILIQRIEGISAGPQMPSPRNPLNQNQQKGLRKWVLEGAKNN